MPREASIFSFFFNKDDDHDDAVVVNVGRPNILSNIKRKKKKEQKKRKKKSIIRLSLTEMKMLANQVAQTHNAHVRLGCCSCNLLFA